MHPAQRAFYRVQVGAFNERSNAEEQLIKLKEAGFDGFIVTVPVTEDASEAESAPAAVEPETKKPTKENVSESDTVAEAEAEK